jgi:3-hydroxybutyryl-CoA dehydrogenase
MVQAITGSLVCSVWHLDRTAGPHPFLRSKVAHGKLGMKTGEGFRRWTPQQADDVRQRLSRFLADQAKARKQTSERS